MLKFIISLLLLQVLSCATMFRVLTTNGRRGVRVAVQTWNARGQSKPHLSLRRWLRATDSSNRAPTWKRKLRNQPNYVCMFVWL